MRTFVIVHLPNGERLADENEKQAALDTMARFSSNAPRWRPEYVPEFSTLDCERFQRALGVILDEARIYLPTVPPIVEIEVLQALQRSVKETVTEFVTDLADRVSGARVDSLEKGIRAFENWQGGLYE